MPVIKQHYVPRELLRNFSCDAEKKRINMFYLTDNKEIENVDLYNQACEKYYYGEDQRLETAYSILEGNFASALRKLINGHTDLTNEEDAAVRVFMVFQLNRTPEAVKRTNSFMSETMKEILRSATTLEKSIKALEKFPYAHQVYITNKMLKNEYRFNCCWCSYGGGFR